MADDFKIDRKAVNPEKYIYRKESDISKTLIDWSSITKDLTEVLTDIRDDRQTKKDEDAKLSQDVTETLTELTVDTEYEPLEVAVRQVTEEYKDFNMMNYNLLKTGQLTRREFASRMAAAQLNMSTFKDLADNFAEKYKIYGDRLVAEDSNIFEHALGESMASFKNLADQDMYVNPVTGNVQLVKKQYKKDKDGNTVLDDDGQPILIRAENRDRSNFKSLKTFGPRLNQKSNFVDVQGEITKNAKSIAIDIDSKFGSLQSVEKIKEALLFKDPDQKSRIIDGYVNSALATETKKVSALQQILGYSKNVFTENPKEVEEWKKQYEVLKKAADMGEAGAQQKLQQWLSGENVKILMKPRGDKSGEMGVEFDDIIMDHLKETVADQYAGRLAREVTLLRGRNPQNYSNKDYWSSLNKNQQDNLGLYEAGVMLLEAKNPNDIKYAASQYANLLSSYTGNAYQIDKVGNKITFRSLDGLGSIPSIDLSAYPSEIEQMRALWGTSSTAGYKRSGGKGVSNSLMPARQAEEMFRKAGRKYSGTSTLGTGGSVANIPSSGIPGLGRIAIPDPADSKKSIELDLTVDNPISKSEERKASAGRNIGGYVRVNTSNGNYIVDRAEVNQLESDLKQHMLYMYDFGTPVGDTPIDNNDIQVNYNDSKRNFGFKVQYDPVASISFSSSSLPKGVKNPQKIIDDTKLSGANATRQAFEAVTMDQADATLKQDQLDAENVAKMSGFYKNYYSRMGRLPNKGNVNLNDKISTFIAKEINKITDSKQRVLYQGMAKNISDGNVLGVFVSFLEDANRSPAEKDRFFEAVLSGNRAARPNEPVSPVTIMILETISPGAGQRFLQLTK